MLLIYFSLLPFMALAGGQIRTSEITNHCKTNIYTIEQFYGKLFELNEKERLISAGQLPNSKQQPF